MREILRKHVRAVAEVAQGMSKHPCLESRVCCDLYHHGWFHLGQRNSISATTEPASYDAVWPGMVRACGNKDGRERHRIGQTRPVTYNVAVAANTIDDSMWSMILDKQQVLDAVLVGIETDDTDETTTAAAQLAWQLTQTGLTRIDTTTA